MPLHPEPALATGACPCSSTFPPLLCADRPFLLGYRDENLNSCALNSAGDGCASATGACVYAAGIASSDVCVANPGFIEEEAIPVVIAQIQTHNADDWVKARLRNVVSSGFELKMEEIQLYYLVN